MIAALLVLASAGTADPRPALAELQLAGRLDDTLAVVEQSLAEEPEGAAELGLDYLRGHLLERAGRIEEANDAFARALDATPALKPYSRFRLAGNWLARGHPEVAAGLFAGVLSSGAPPPLADPATDLLIRTLEAGGDCRLLGQLDAWPLSPARRRKLELARADCELRQGNRDDAVARLLRLVEQEQDDEPARGAAERLSRLAETLPASPETALIIGRIFHRNRLFELSISYLSRGLEPAAGLAPPADEDHLYALARSYFWQRDYLVAAAHFGRLAATTPKAELKARSLHQQGRSYELSGNWDAAAQSYRLAYLAEPGGRWADAALLSALRIEWRTGDEDAALQVYRALGQRRDWRRLFARAALFMASSDIVRGRPDRAPLWLDHAEQTSAEAAVEVAYWRGRLAELEERWRAAVESYLAAMTAHRFHPFAQAARVRLAGDELAPLAAALGRELARASDAASHYQAWLLLGDGDAAGARARERLQASLARARAARSYLEIDLRPTADWPLWQASLEGPEDRLLALGVWGEGSTAVPRHFPVADASLGFTGGRILARGEAHRESLRIAEILGQRAEAEIPAALLPVRFRRLLFPLPWGELIREQAARRNVEPHLLAALIREESRFDPDAVSSASARGLTQFVLPTARRLAPAVGRPSLSAEDLHDPEVSIALGAAYLAELAGRYGNSAPQVIAAYNAGEPQADLWRTYCYSHEPEEYLSKVGFPETRDYLERVLISRAEYRELYPEI